MLGLLRHLLRCLQEHVIGEDGQVLADPLPAHDALLILQEKCPSGYPAHHVGAIELRTCRPVHDSVRTADLHSIVAEQGIG